MHDGLRTQDGYTKRPIIFLKHQSLRHGVSQVENRLLIYNNRHFDGVRNLPFTHFEALRKEKNISHSTQHDGCPYYELI